MLTPGTKLGPYEILAFIGAGGMGEVYRARDQRLGREVAIKTSTEQFSDRFEREARAIAALNHPHICTLHDVGPNYLVMELVEGATLAERIEQGPIPLEESIQITRQIASALDTAHSRGIVHRDLKSSNIKLTPGGVVKVLDFGLAKQGESEALRENSEHAATAAALTQAGAIVGTAAYMAPEQARGQVVDKRADIWAFGVVLYEMVTGHRPFEGPSTSDTMAVMLTSEPAWGQVPQPVEPLIRRCLVKDPQKRLRDIGDIEFLLQAAPATARLRQSWLPWIAAAVLTLALAPLAFVHFRERPQAASQMRFQIPPGVTPAASGNIAVSPDGRKLAFMGIGSDGLVRVWLRDLSSLVVRPLQGSESAANAPPFFWSPDSRFIAFDAGGKLKKLNVSGGPAEVLVDLPTPIIGGSWNRHGDILMGTPSGILRVHEAGGPATAVTTLDAGAKEDSHLLPTFLADGRHFIYLRVSRASPDNGGIHVGSLDVAPDKQSSTRILPYAPGLAYVPPIGGSPGRVLFVREGTLLAVPFDERQLAVAGETTPVAEQVGVYLDTAFFAASHTDVLAFRTADPPFQVTWFDRRGTPLQRVSEPAQYAGLALSPDGQRVVVSVTNPRDRAVADLYLLDFARGGSANRFTFGTNQRADFPVWSADGRSVAFRIGGPGSTRLYRKTLDASAPDQELLPGPQRGLVAPASLSPDGRHFLYAATSPATGWDLWVARLDGTETRDDAIRMPFAQTRFNEAQGRFSPDGRWIAYVSNETGLNEVYLRSFSEGSNTAGGLSVLVSRGGGTSPTWRQDGKELYYLTPDDRLMSATLLPGNDRRIGSTSVLFQSLPGAILGGATPDGQRFLMVQTGAAPFTMVLNWTKN